MTLYGGAKDDDTWTPCRSVDGVTRRGGRCQSIRRQCFACHVAARPEWDLVCESGHGWGPIPVTCAMIAALQQTDPPCNNSAPSPEEAEALRQLQELLKPGDKQSRSCESALLSGGQGHYTRRPVNRYVTLGMCGWAATSTKPACSRASISSRPP
jgi:hypothetical protein